MTMNVSVATSRRAFVRLALGAAVTGPLAASAGCSVLNGSSESGPSSAGPEKSRITVGIPPSQGSAPSKLAEKYGYFTKEGLQVTLKTIAAGLQSFAPLQNGEMDFAVVDYVSFFQAVAQNALDAKIVVDGNMANENSVVVMAKPNSGIVSARDLTGKRIGIQQPGSLAELLVRATLRDNDVDPESPHYLPVKFPDIPAAVAGGQLDAGVEVEPYLTGAEQKQGLAPVLKIVAGSTANMPQTGYIATSKFVAANPNTVASFQRAMVLAQTDAADRAKLSDVLADLTGVDRATAALFNIDTYPTSLNPTQIQRVISLMQAYGGLTAQLDATKLIVPTPQA